ncbi:hypothetical protein [Pedobacter sp. Leaf216]|uniref:hypothetical protein n=1 Tax=Pedobacter sp. Leaf216 TaxID=1735684 RepID=UPI000ABDCF52|nr:hypothetical protein [Pedobacter sp. Leaf216]
MIDVLTEFGFASLGFKKDDFLKENYVSQIGYPPLRIDILNAISGVEFDEAFENKIDAEIDGLVTPFINVQDFIANKIASGRLKDLADIKELQKRINKKKS